MIAPLVITPGELATIRGEYEDIRNRNGAGAQFNPDALAALVLIERLLGSYEALLPEALLSGQEVHVDLGIYLNLAMHDWVDVPDSVLQVRVYRQETAGSLWLRRKPDPKPELSRASLEMVRGTLRHLGRSREQFDADVLEAMAEQESE